MASAGCKEDKFCLESGSQSINLTLCMLVPTVGRSFSRSVLLAWSIAIHSTVWGSAMRLLVFIGRLLANIVIVGKKKNRRALHRLKPEAILKTEFYEYERIACDMPPSTHKQSMWAERERPICRSPLKPTFETPALRSAPAHRIFRQLRSRSAPIKCSKTFYSSVFTVGLGLMVERNKKPSCR